MIEWVPYSEHNITVCAQSLADDRWVPVALLWKSGGRNERRQTVWGEPPEFCKRGTEADRVALRKATRWIDPHR